MVRRLMTLAALAVAVVLPALASGAPPPTGCCTLTASDSGDLFKVQRGQVIDVRLVGSPPSSWTVPRATSLAVVRRQVTRVGGYVTAVFVARRLGHVELRALEQPACRAKQPRCGAPIRLFFVRLLIH